MSQTANLNSSTARALQLRVRPDLQAERQSYQGRECWVLKDPLTLKYFRFEDEEYALLRMLDGVSSAEEIQARFEAEFAPQQLTFAELYQFVGMLHRSSLLVSDRPGQGFELLRRSREQASKRRRQSLANLLAFRFRGVDPDRFLSRLAVYSNWFFSRWAWSLVLLLGLSAGCLLLANFEQFQSKLPTFRDFFAGENWFSLALVLAATKILHELGHGLACKRFGGECHELGVMFLVFTPCLYCNVSDSWMLPNKWHRIIISAAGMYVELVLAAVATWVWWFSQPGLVQQLALNVMFVCSASTLLFNANPLMKYDGYYMLADWLEIPNLRQKASALLSRAASHWFLGLPGRVDPFLPTRQRWMFCAYSLAAASYRWLVTLSIFWFLYAVLEPYGFKVVGQLLAILAISNLVVAPARQAYRFFSVPGRWTAVNRTRLSYSLAAAGMGLAAVVLIPLPYSVRCTLYVEAAQSRTVFVEQPGFLSEILVQPGDQVEPGQPLLKLVNHELESEIVRMSGELSMAEAQLRLTQTYAAADDEIGDQLKTAAAIHTAAENKLRQRLEDQSKLTIRAPGPGYLLPPARRPAQPASEERLGHWSGTPLELDKKGAWLDAQTQIGRIVEQPAAFQATLIIDQSDIESVSAGQSVQLWIREFPSQVIPARIQSVSVEAIREIPRALSNRHGGEVVTRPDNQNREVPESPAYQAAATFQLPNVSSLQGATGVGRIRVGYRTLGQRGWRWLQKTFRFDL